MPINLSLEMITPERIVLRSTASFVVLPAWQGEMGVLPGHEPYLVGLGEGEVRVTAEGELHSYAIAGGFAEILKDRISIFTETAEIASEIDAERTRQAMEQAQAEIKRPALDPLTLAGAEAAIRFAQAKLRIADLRKRGKTSGLHPHAARDLDE